MGQGIGLGGAGALLDATPAYFSETKKQDFTRYFQSLDTNSCELIAIGHASGAHFRSAHHPLSLSTMDALQREKAQKFCSWLIVACASLWNIGVSCDHVSRLGTRRFRCLEANICTKAPAAPLVRCAVAKGCGERWMSLSVNLALGGGNRVIRAQRIC